MTVCYPLTSRMLAVDSQVLELGCPPDLERTTDNPFRASITFRLTVPQCTPLGQCRPLRQLSVPIPLPNPSTSEELMPPSPKRQRLDEPASALGAPPAAVKPPLDLALPPFDMPNLTISPCQPIWTGTCSATTPTT